MHRTPFQIEHAHALGLEPLEGAFADLTGIFWGMCSPFDEAASAIQSSSAGKTSCDWLAGVNAIPCCAINRPVLGKRLSRSIGSPVWEAVVHAHGFQPLHFHSAGHRDEVISSLDDWSGAVYVKRQGSEQGGLVLPAAEVRGHASTVGSIEPVLLAQVPVGQLVSVFVVDGRVAATVVRNGWQPASAGSVAHLGSSLLTRCGELAQSLELSFAECLLVAGADGRVSCLDVIGVPNYWSTPRDVLPHVVTQLAQYLTGEKSASRSETHLKADGVSVPGACTSVGGADVQ